MKVEFAETRRNYVITQDELKKKLGIVGDIKSMGLWSGQSPKDIEEEKDCEGNAWFIETVEPTRDSEGELT